ncbi:MAG: hypothetical protein J6D87_10450 [Clostridia bacterium]|nr:hypothetical protein [Clostridia bacterium]
MKKFLSVLLVILSAASFIVSFALIVMLSDRSPTASASEAMYHTARFAWLAFLFMLIPLGCLAFGIGLKIKKNLVIGIVFSALLLIYGGLLSVSLTQYSTDAEYLDGLKTELGIAFPEDMTVITQDWTGGKQTSSDEYLLRYDSVARFASPSDAEAFLEGMDTEAWLTDKASITEGIPTITALQTNDCEYFLLYCYETDSFNEAVSEAQYNYIYMALDTEESVLFITEFTHK